MSGPARAAAGSPGVKGSLGYVCGLAAAAVGLRIAVPMLGLPWHLELLTALALCSAMLAPRRVAVLVPIVAVAISDLVLGNTALLWVTWSAWALIGVGALALNGARARHVGARVLLPLLAAGFGVGATAFFFLWTNVGFWLVTSQYPHSAQGLIAALVAGLPFVRAQLFGNLVLVPLAAWVATRIGSRSLVVPVRDRGSIERA